MLLVVFFSAFIPVAHSIQFMRNFRSVIRICLIILQVLHLDLVSSISICIFCLLGLSAVRVTLEGTVPHIRDFQNLSPLWSVSHLKSIRSAMDLFSFTF